MTEKKLVLDLTHRLETGMPTYPGDQPQPQIITRKESQYTISALHLGSHYGTHIDAPRHFLPNGKTIDDFAISLFSGSALCISRESECASALDLTNAELLRIKDLHPKFLIIRTGFDRYWGDPKYFQEHPYLSPEFARRIIDLRIEGIGGDFPSMDAADADAQNYPVHHLLMEREILIIENLTNLAGLPDEPFTLVALPLKIATDGAPARVVAYL